MSNFVLSYLNLYILVRFLSCLDSKPKHSIEVLKRALNHSLISLNIQYNLPTRQQHKLESNAGL
jgi:hypothetical protein